VQWLVKLFTALQPKRAGGAYPADRAPEEGDIITWYARNGDNKGYHAGWVTHKAGDILTAVDDRYGEKYFMIELRGDRYECER
jgi:hypothetical protein